MYSTIGFYRAGDLTADLTADEIKSFTLDLRREGARMVFREMTPDDVATVVDRFADAALRARRAGFDGVELHAGHDGAKVNPDAHTPMCLKLRRCGHHVEGASQGRLRGFFQRVQQAGRRHEFVADGFYFFHSVL